ncbi:MAG: glycine--tRNA ligase [DPANN group archaeon]|nr:glycine--tRNA ligase [DPANN group archaeon]
MTRYDDIIQVCLRRGIFYPSGEIYGSFAGFYDYGVIGTKIKHKLERQWRAYFLNLDDNFHEIEVTNVMPEAVFRGSGHLENFVDPVLQCSKCDFNDKADDFLGKIEKRSFENTPVEAMNQYMHDKKTKCPQCGSSFKEIENLNLMFNFQVGSNKQTRGYLRPETAQGPYLSFKREYLANREKLPLGLAIVGKAYRNEISPRQGLFRTREFTQAELQIFFDPDTLDEHDNYEAIKGTEIYFVDSEKRDKGAQKVKVDALRKKGYAKKYLYYLAKFKEFYDSLGVKNDDLRFYEKNQDEKAFYNKYHIDIEGRFESFDDFREIGAMHYRTDHDLTGHARESKKELSINREGKKFVPHVIEMTFGVDRNLFFFLDRSYTTEKDRTYFSLPKPLAPNPVGVYPLVKKDGLAEKAQQVYNELRKQHVEAIYDEAGSIGRRYARADEVGVPYGITIDYDTMQDGTVTLRERDSTKQSRIQISDIAKKIS